MSNKILDIIIIGGGQSALACAYYLRRSELEYLVLDRQPQCGGSWNEVWDSLTLFSPAQHSSLPGWLMPKTKGEYPSKAEVIQYLCDYEKRYQVPVRRNVEVMEVSKEGNLFNITTNQGMFKCKTVISATGSWQRPYIPEISGRNNFRGMQIHSKEYKNAEAFNGQKVLVVGEGNSGAQILAEVSKEAETYWATDKIPQFLPDDVDGKVLFDVATAKYHAQQKGEKFDSTKYSLGSIVVVPPVKEARARDVLHSAGKVKSFTENAVIWEDGSLQEIDTIIWCTGFLPATNHLKKLVNTDEKGRIKTEGTRAVEVEGLWLVGYGSWTGFASATLIGVGRSARKTVKEIESFLNSYKKQ